VEEREKVVEGRIQGLQIDTLNHPVTVKITELRTVKTASVKFSAFCLAALSLKCYVTAVIHFR